MGREETPRWERRPVYPWWRAWVVLPEASLEASRAAAAVSPAILAPKRRLAEPCPAHPLAHADFSPAPRATPTWENFPPACPFLPASEFRGLSAGHCAPRF